MNDTDPRLWHPWLNRVLRVMLHTRWSAEAWAQVRVEFRRAERDPARGVVQLGRNEVHGGAVLVRDGVRLGAGPHDPADSTSADHVIE